MSEAATRGGPGAGTGELEQLAGLGERMAGAQDEPRLAELFTEATRDLLGSRELFWLSDRHERTPGWDETDRLILRRAALAELAGASRAVQVPDEVIPPGLLKTLGGKPLSAAVLRVNREPVGVIGAAGGADEERRRALLGLLARLASSALATLRSGEALRDESRALVAQLDTRTRDLRRAEAQIIASDRLATLGTLVAGIGHEVTNPLATVMLNNGALSARLSRAGLPAGLLTEAQRLITENDEALERIRSLVGELRTYARRDDEGLHLVDLRPIVDSSLRLARAHLRPIEVVVELDRLPPVRGSASRLGQALLNLLVNAAQAVAGVERPKIVVKGVVDGSEVRLGVLDNGYGIADEVRPRLFEMFFTTKPAGEGTGLGLAIVSDILARHGGRVDVDSRPGEGAAFWLVLPAASGQPAKPRATPSSPGVQPVLRRPSQPAIPAMVDAAPRPRILVIDDEQLILRALERELTEEFDVVTARSGDEASRAIDGVRFDAVLCDVNLNGEDGREIMSRLDTRTPGIVARTVFMSGGAQDVAREMRAARFVAKPFAMGKLMQLLRGVIAGES